MSSTPWVVCGRQGVEVGFCRRCGAGLSLVMPLALDSFAQHLSRFAYAHEGCGGEIKNILLSAAEARAKLDKDE